jgi:hypothetical protein
MTTLREDLYNLDFTVCYNIEDKILTVVDSTEKILVEKPLNKAISTITVRNPDYQYIRDKLLLHPSFESIDTKKLKLYLEESVTALKLQYKMFILEESEKNQPKAAIIIDKGVSNGIPRSIQLLNGMPISVSGNDWRKLVDIEILDIKLYEPLYPEFDSQHSLIDIEFKAHNKIYRYNKISIGSFLNKLNNVHYLKISIGNDIQEVSELIMQFALSKGNVSVATGAPGIFYKDNNIYIEDIEPPEEARLKEAIATLEDLKNDIEPELQEMFINFILWNLGASFEFARKIKGNSPDFYPHIISYGLGQTSKSTLMQLAMSIWKPYKDIISSLVTGKGGFDSDSRMRNAINKETFPVVVEELPDSGTEAMDFLKNISNTPDSYIMHNDGITKRHFLHLSRAYISTNNTPTINDSGAARRMLILNFDNFTKPIDDKTAERFSNKWLKSEKLDILTEIGKAAAYYIKDNPEVIALKWQSVGPKILEAIGGPKWTYSKAFNTNITREESVEINLSEVQDFLYSNVRNHAERELLIEDFETMSEITITELLLNILPTKTNWVSLVSNRTEYALNVRMIRQYIKSRDPETNISESDIKNVLGLKTKSVKVIGRNSKSRKQIINIYKFGEILELFNGKEDYWKEFFNFLEE